MSKVIRELEERIVRKLVQDALSTGHRISVSSDGGYDIDDMLLGATQEDHIVNEVFASDACHVFFHQDGEPLLTEDGKVSCNGWAYLVFGNEGWDVVNDYTTGIENLMAGAMEIANQYS